MDKRKERRKLRRYFLRKYRANLNSGQNQEEAFLNAKEEIDEELKDNLDLSLFNVLLPFLLMLLDIDLDI